MIEMLPVPDSSDLHEFQEKLLGEISKALGMSFARFSEDHTSVVRAEILDRYRRLKIAGLVS